MVPFDVATKRVVFGGQVFICRNVKDGAPGYIMLEVDTILVTELVPLTPCSGAGSGTVTSGGATSGCLLLTLCGARGDGQAAATGACSCRAAIAATCYTRCWRRMYVADNAWLLAGPWLGASISPMDAVSFHCD